MECPGYTGCGASKSHPLNPSALSIKTLENASFCGVVIPKFFRPDLGNYITPLSFAPRVPNPSNPMGISERQCSRVGVTLTTMPDEVRHDASDTPRPSATRYTLSLDETALRFVEAGLPRNIRSLQRYCAAGRLDCIKEETVSGLAYFVDPDSVERAITQLAQLHGITDEVRHVTTVLDMSHHVASEDQPRTVDDTPRSGAADRDNDTPETPERQSPPQPDVSLYVARLEGENVFLRDQIGVKDTQIAALLERDKETNFLIRGLQTMLAPLLGTGERPDPPEHRTN